MKNAFCLFAQPVLGLNYAATNGVTFQLYTSRGAVRPSTGPNQVWNLPSGTKTLVSNWTQHPNPGAPQVPEMGGATYHYKILTRGDSMSQFYLVSGLGIENRGNQDNGISRKDSSYSFPVQNSHPLLLPFNLAFGQKLPNEFYQEYVNNQANPSRFYYHYFDTLTYSGYGSLTLEGITYKNAILVRNKQALYNAPALAGPYQLYGTYDYQNVFVPGLGVPIYQFFTSQIGTRKDSSGYIVSGIVTSNSPTVSIKTFRAWPVPSSGKVRINLPQSSGMVSIFSITGQKLQDLPNVQGEVDLSALPPSMYMLECRIKDEIYRQRVVRE